MMKMFNGNLLIYNTDDFHEIDGPDDRAVFSKSKVNEALCEFYSLGFNDGIKFGRTRGFIIGVCSVSIVISVITLLFVFASKGFLLWTM